ncbi:hypothetical protein PHLGIDRAFT_101969 [Phlebiopsis gigantea 11061_1 CR5-6]|uniref:Glucose receptor Git3 N-terminal domain-containing protein n=1 Tax=Phlebiopsis gigantea (strain 11061_1 CR5-6) TaxID=745531 RepID=A0A0C3SDS5_PHLG1|nr:hypothetical protein PHLGIDRAFT_101969 [Phlebiopsis gigantea 11061_1 CR5-6]
MEVESALSNAMAGPYDNAHVTGVVSLVIAGILSWLAVLFILSAMVLRVPAFTIHVMPYFISLLVANILQAAGAMINVKWVVDRSVEAGALCSLQGGIKQAGNVGTAVWSFVLSVYVFRLLFLRTTSSAMSRYVTLCVGWLAIVFVVAIGPIAIQTKERGPYFGPSGYWCWITHEYPEEQTFLEYFFEFVSAGMSFILYIIILLRVRGNLVQRSDGWRLRFVPRSERWMLAINRDWLDSSSMCLAARMLWYPIVYSLLLIPVAITRFFEFGGIEIPFWATILTDTLFNLQGLANAVLLTTTRRVMSETASLPSFSAPRKVIDASSPGAMGITPFVLPPPEPSDQQEAKPNRLAPSSLYRSTSVASASTIDSQGSVDSQTPLNGR